MRTKYRIVLSLFQFATISQLADKNSKNLHTYFLELLLAYRKLLIFLESSNKSWYGKSIFVLSKGVFSVSGLHLFTITFYPFEWKCFIVISPVLA